MKIAYFGLFYLENLNSDFGFLNADRQSPGPNRDSENLKKIAIPRFEKNGLKIWGWGTFGVYPLRGSGPQILFSIIIALWALKQMNFVWGESAHIWGSYGGLKIAILAYFGLFYLENLNSDFGFLKADRQSLGPYRDSENLRRIAIHSFEKWGFEIWGWALLGFTPLGGPDPKSYFCLL